MAEFWHPTGTRGPISTVDHVCPGSR